MISNAINNHKLSAFLAFCGAVLWAATGDYWFAIIGLALFIIAASFKRFVRTILWIALGAYAAFIMPPNGWFFVLLGCIVCMSLPWTRGITPVADFSKSKGT